MSSCYNNFTIKKHWEKKNKHIAQCCRKEKIEYTHFETWSNFQSFCLCLYSSERKNFEKKILVLKQCPGSECVVTCEGLVSRKKKKNVPSISFSNHFQAFPNIFKPFLTILVTSKHFQTLCYIFRHFQIFLRRVFQHVHD